MPFDNAGFISEKKLRDKRFREATKLHEILKIAIEDFKAVKAQPKKYKIDMGVFYEPSVRGRCAVCLAGSVIAMSIEHEYEDAVLARQGRELGPCSFDDEPGLIDFKLCALDDLRRGDIREASWQITGCYGDLPEHVRPTLRRRANESYVAFFERVHAVLVKHDL